MPALRLRPAGPQDLVVLRAWDEQPHLQAATGPNSDWDWVNQLARDPWPDWRDWLMAEVSEGGEGDWRPVGFLAIIDPAREESQYWGPCPPGLRAIHIWLGEERDQRQGFGRRMMAAALDRCFADPGVRAVLIDPLVANTAAHRFYEAMGFTRVDRRMFGDDDCFVYRLERKQWSARAALKEGGDAQSSDR